MLEIQLNLKKILSERGITQKELAEKTGLRQNIISEIANNQRQIIYREHVAKIIEYLEISDMNEIFELKKTDN
ncbi:helix-turn-helix domain-containing protein [Lysinibacillus sp. NPDC048646]|uniref:helix-turn-helix domain-containing protein n=1 Tax=Lysinibacillus sp. NPDC048646 TaxID=3390574 RepID=UPI003D00A040